LVNPSDAAWHRAAGRRPGDNIKESHMKAMIRIECGGSARLAVLALLLAACQSGEEALIPEKKREGGGGGRKKKEKK
jgi:hypothetical protein